MWFKAYVLDESNRPTDISRVLYVELVSPEGGVVKTHKCKIEDGMAHGDFYLDSAYLSGFFEVRAYTRHMRNFGEDNYFSQVFPVFEEAVGGDYSIRTMYDRLRPEGLGKEQQPDLAGTRPAGAEGKERHPAVARAEGGQRRHPIQPEVQPRTHTLRQHPRRSPPRGKGHADLPHHAPQHLLPLRLRGRKPHPHGLPG